MKKSLALLCLILMTMTLWSADRVKRNGLVYNLDHTTMTAEVTSKQKKHLYRGKNYKDATIVIPSTIKYKGRHYKVTSIGEEAFYGCWELKSVSIPNSVKTIGKEAFRACFHLQSLTIPESVTSIGEEAFAFCDHLISISVASGNKYYDSRNNCNALIETATNKLIAGCKNTVIPKGVTSIGSHAFVSCDFKSIEIPNGVESIEEWAFAFCDELKSIKIPNGVKSIGWCAFAYCSGLTSVVVPKSVTSIGEQAFEQCKNLASVKLSKQTKLGDDVFKDCSKSLQLAYYSSFEEQGALPGVFTVSASGKKVRFSQGNLQYDRVGKKFQFAEEQWAVIGTENIEDMGGYFGLRKGVLADVIDLFGWSGKNSNAPWGASASDKNSDYIGIFQDWGKNAILNGGNMPNLWRTLTEKEWDYLLNERADGWAVLLRDFITIDGVKGLAIFPDNFNLGWYADHIHLDWKLTREEWRNFEERGCVFLPDNEIRMGNVFIGSSDVCVYSTATRCTDKANKRVLRIYPESRSVDVIDIPCVGGICVRLVQDVK